MYEQHSTFFPLHLSIRHFLFLHQPWVKSAVKILQVKLMEDSGLCLKQIWVVENFLKMVVQNLTHTGGS